MFLIKVRSSSAGDTLLTYLRYVGSVDICRFIFLGRNSRKLQEAVEAVPSGALALATAFANWLCYP